MKKEQQPANMETTIELKPPTDAQDASVKNHKKVLARLSDIDPKNSPSFSQNLYLWLRKYRKMRLLADRYDVDGVDYIGYMVGDEYLIGSELRDVLCNGEENEIQTFQAPNKIAIHRPLWEDYLLRGVCAIDNKHELLIKHDRFTTNGKVRICKWCGHFQQLESYKIEMSCEMWINAEDNSGNVLLQRILNQMSKYNSAVHTARHNVRVKKKKDIHTYKFSTTSKP